MLGVGRIRADRLGDGVRAVRGLHQTMHRRRVGQAPSAGVRCRRRRADLRAAHARTSCSGSGRSRVHEGDDRVLDAHGVRLAHPLGEDRELHPVLDLAGPDPAGERGDVRQRARSSRGRGDVPQAAFERALAAGREGETQVGVPTARRSRATSRRTIPWLVTRFAYDRPDASWCSNRGAPPRPGERIESRPRRRGSNRSLRSRPRGPCPGPRLRS